MNFEADTPVHLGNIAEAEAAFQAKLKAMLNPDVGTIGHIDHGKPKTYQPKLNRAQRRAQKHKK
jgi:translation elongation factor EF-Tu-like GTPase